MRKKILKVSSFWSLSYIPVKKSNIFFYTILEIFFFKHLLKINPKKSHDLGWKSRLFGLDSFNKITQTVNTANRTALTLPSPESSK